MATITSRKTASGEMRHRVTIRLKKDGAIVHQESKTFANKATAKEWARRREAELDDPAVLAYGCVVVFTREGGGHVGFVVGRDQHGNLMVLGGNQGDAVSIKPFLLSRVTGFRWPSAYPSSGRFNLPVLDSDGKVSANEA